MKVFITGASSGLGASLAEHYAGRGASLEVGIEDRRGLLAQVAAGTSVEGEGRRGGVSHSPDRSTGAPITPASRPGYDGGTPP